MSDQQNDEAKANFAKALDEFKNRVRNEAAFSEDQKRDLLLQADAVQSLDTSHLQKLQTEYGVILESNAAAKAKEEEVRAQAEREASSNTQTDSSPEPTPKKEEEPLKRKPGDKGRGLSLAKPKK